MISLRLASLSLALAILPGSCIAAPVKLGTKVGKPVSMERIPEAAPVPLSVGLFKLDKLPEQGGLARGHVPSGSVRLVVDGQNVPLAQDGAFVVGFGRDYKDSTTIVAFKTNGSAVTEKLSVAKRAWHIENLATLPHHSQPDAEFAARRPGELAQINAARRMNPVSDGWRQRFIWPARGRVSGFFGSQRIYAGEPGAPHSGVDVAGTVGTPVAAPADGVVILAAASPFTLEGNLLMIDHGMGVNSAFLHLSRIDVKKGDVVRQGQIVGAIGMTGRATGPHLHWGMKWQDERLDPQALAGAMR
jgi:murein DD-endopeptidase MepM/ murein hydrolase activator NlpD